MVKELSPVPQSLAIQTQSIGRSNAFEKLGQASGELSGLLTQATAQIGIDDAARRGQSDALSGNAPLGLAPGINKATANYNNAVSDIEAVKLVQSGRDQINQAYAESSNPATFNAESPARFNATVDGIIEGTMQGTRDQNRAQVMEVLGNLKGQAAVKMTSNALEFDNKKIKAGFKKENDSLFAELKNTSIAGDKEASADIENQIKANFNSYSQVSNEIKSLGPDLSKKLDDAKVINGVLAGYSEATSERRGSEFLAGFMSNKDNLPLDQWQTAAKELVTLEGFERKLGYQAHSEANAIVEGGIKEGSITSVDQFESNPNLTTLQVINNTNLLKSENRKNAGNNANLLQAQKDISNGNPQNIKSGTADEMYNNWRGGFEAHTGKAPNVFDSWNSWQGKGSFPLSGISGQPYGRDIPEFNRDVTAMLTNQDPLQIVQAAALFKEANLSAKDNGYAAPIELTGDALDIASSFNILDRGGLNNDQRVILAQRVNDSIMKVSEPERDVRRARANTFTAKQADMEKLYEAQFGTKFVPGLSDATMGVMKENIKLSIQNTGNTEAATLSNKFSMKDFGTSIYYPEGMVAQNRPESLPIFGVANSLQNQFGISTQLLINSNADVQASLGPDDARFKIEWVKPEQQSVNVTDETTDDERVFGNMSGMLKTLRQQSRESTERDLPGIDAATGEKDAPVAQGKIPVKINGFNTEIYWQPTNESELGSRLSYALFYTDQTGQPQAVPDARQPDNVARFSPVGLDRYAPDIFESNRSDDMKKIATKVQRESALSELKFLKDSLPKENMLSKLFSRQDEMGDILRLSQSNPEKAKELAAKLDGNDIEGAIKLLRQRIQGAPEDEAAKSDNVGIAADTGAKPEGIISAGNIDLSNRPQVKNKDGSISTVRSITVEMDGMHFVLPTVTDDGRIASNKEAIQIAKDTGKNLGVFETAKQANKFAQDLHESEAKKLKGRN